MQKEHLYRNRSKNRPGFASLLMLLIIFVVGALIWLKPSAFFNSEDSNLPWTQEHRILRKGQEPKHAVSSQQPDMTKPLYLWGKAKQLQQDRGEITLYIQPDGTIKGSWGGGYISSPKVTHDVVGSFFKGNIDPSAIYMTGQKEDLTKLYFITKGMFSILETNDKTGQCRHVKGEIFVTGWINSGHNVRGQIVLTSDRKNYKTFTWQCKAERMENSFEPEIDEDQTIYPWQENHLFATKTMFGHKSQSGRAPTWRQPKFEKSRSYTANLYDGSKERGQINLIISKDYTARGTWTGNMKIKDKLYKADVHEDKNDRFLFNTFKGNLASLKPYEDEDGTDRSKLYVITSGPYELQRVGGNAAISGHAYITAWIDKKYKAHGTLAIREFTDKKMAIFKWGPVSPAKK
jgi:hypothetical protein